MGLEGWRGTAPPLHLSARWQTGKRAMGLEPTTLSLGS